MVHIVLWGQSKKSGSASAKNSKVRTNTVWENIEFWSETQTIAIEIMLNLAPAT